MKEYKATIIVAIGGGIIPYEGGWWTVKKKAEAEAMGIVESKLPAGMYDMVTRFEERAAA